MKKTITIPESMQIYPFFKETNEELLIGEADKESIPFYDVLEGIEQVPSDWEARLDHYFMKWKKSETILTELYEKRNKQEIRPIMISMLANYITILFWMNDKQPIQLKTLANEIDQLQNKPINIKERLLFILSKPELFHSFVQLRELYVEIEKLHAKMIMMSTYKKKAVLPKTTN